MYITVKTHQNERNKINYYRKFEIVNALPEIGEIEEVSPEYNGEKTTVVSIREVSIDCENRDEAFEYSYYVIEKKFEVLNDDGEWECDSVNEFHYVAIEKKGE